MNSDVKTVEELLQTAIPPGDRGLPTDRVRRAIVTGGSTGIGRYTAIALAKDGCDVAVTYAHNRDDAELTAEAIRTLGAGPLSNYWTWRIPNRSFRRSMRWSPNSEGWTFSFPTPARW